MDKAYDVLNPAGILMVIVPLSFMQSEFWEKTRVANINKDFFLFQYLRPLVVIAASCHAPLHKNNSQHLLSALLSELFPNLILRDRIFQTLLCL